MRLITSELRKLSSKRTLILLALLMIANIVSMYFATKESAARENEIAPYREAFEEIDRICSSDPQKYLDYYVRLNEDMEKAHAEWEASIPMFPVPDENGNIPEFVFEYSTPSTLVKGYEDLDILTLYFKNSSNYKSKLENTVTSARKTLDMLTRFGIDTNRQNGVYQQRMIDLYSPMIEEDDEFPAIVHGWDGIMSYENRIIFLAVAAILIGVSVGFAERESGVEPIMRVTHKGRLHTGAAKCGSLIAASFASTLLIIIPELIFISIRFGLSDPLRSVHNLEAYIFSPYTATILEAFAMNVLGMALCALFLASLAFMLTCLTRSVILPLIFCGLLVAVNLLLHWMPSLPDFRYFNIFEIAAGSFIRRPTVIGLSALGVRMFPVSAGIALGLILALFIAAVLLFAVKRPNTKVRRVKTPALISKLRDRISHISAIKPRPSLIRGEIRKSASLLLALALILLIGVRIYQSKENFGAPKNDIRLRAGDYVQKYGGVMTAEKAEAMKAEQEEFTKLTDEETSQRYMFDYALGNITSEEYFDYKQRAAKAKAALPYLGELVIHADYLQKTSEEKGVDTWLIYEYGYTDYLGATLDLPLYLIILLTLAAVFAREYTGQRSGEGFIALLRSTKKGRDRVFAAKLISALSFAGAVSLIFSALDLYLMVKYSGSSGLSAPLCSIERYSGAPGYITVGGYLAMVTLFRLLGALLLALVECAISCLAANTRLTLALTAALTLFPFALYYFGIEIAKYFDFTALLSANRLFLISISTGGGMTFFFLFTALTAAVAAVLNIFSFRKFCK